MTLYRLSVELQEFIDTGFVTIGKSVTAVRHKERMLKYLDLFFNRAKEWLEENTI